MCSSGDLWSPGQDSGFREGSYCNGSGQDKGTALCLGVWGGISEWSGSVSSHRSWDVKVSYRLLDREKFYKQGEMEELGQDDPTEKSPRSVTPKSLPLASTLHLKWDVFFCPISVKLMWLCLNVQKTMGVNTLSEVTNLAAMTICE